MNIVTISDQPSIPPILVFEIVSEIGNEQIDGKLNIVFCLSSLFAITTILLWLLYLNIIFIILILLSLCYIYVTSINRPFYYLFVCFVFLFLFHSF